MSALTATAVRKTIRAVMFGLATGVGLCLASAAHADSKPIQAADVLLSVDASVPFTNYRWLWGTECDGQILGAIQIPETGIEGTDLPGIGTLRFGKAADPSDATGTRKVLQFRINQNDPITSGAPRCELTFSPSFQGKLPIGKEFWFAFGLQLPDWAYPNPDDQVLMQWFWGNGSIPLGPVLGMRIQNDGFVMDGKYSTTYPPSISNAVPFLLWNNANLPVKKWTYFVIKAKLSHDVSQNPYVKVWRDGMQVVDYAGPIGYNYPEVQPFAKVGLYHWTYRNPWSASMPTKTLLYRAPSLINDPTGRTYSEADIRAYVQAH